MFLLLKAGDGRGGLRATLTAQECWGIFRNVPSVVIARDDMFTKVLTES